MSNFKKTMWKNLYYKFVFDLIKVYTNIQRIYDKYILKIVHDLNNKIYNHSIVEVNVYDTILLDKRTLYHIDCYDYMYHVFLYFTNKDRLKSVIMKDFKLERCYSSHLYDRPIYEIKYHNGDKILVRSENDKHFVAPNIMLLNHPHNKYLYATINEECDITHFVNKHVGSFNDHLNLSAIELASIAFIDKMINYDIYVKLLKDNNIYVFLINNDTLQETIFKDNDILIL